MSVIYGTPPGPKITNVYIGALPGGSGSIWSGVFLNYLGSNYGYNIPVGRIASANNTSALNVNSRGQLNSLPWSNLNCITIAFDQEINVNSGNLIITGLLRTYNITNFIDRGFVDGKHYISWYFDQSNRPASERLYTDKIRITLSSNTISSKSFNSKLAGQIVNSTWTTIGDAVTAAGESLPSKPGNNQNFSLILNILPGNIDTDRTTTPNDMFLLSQHNNRTTASGNYSPFVDINGDGIVQGSTTGIDRIIAVNYLNLSVPTGTI